MAEPPPIDFEVESEEPSPQEEEEKPEEKPEAKPEEDEEEEEDLFSSPEVPQQQAGEEKERGEGDQEPSKPAQLIVETEKEPPTEVEPDTSSAPTLEIHAADESEDVVVQTKPVAPPPAKTLDLFDEEEEPKKEEQQVITWFNTSRFSLRLRAFQIRCSSLTGQTLFPVWGCGRKRGGKKSGVSGPYSVTIWNAIIGEVAGSELTRHAIDKPIDQRCS